MSITDHPFQPGTAVGICTGYGPNAPWRRDKVLKVHKSGRFTLKSEPSQQWSASAPSTMGGDVCWSGWQSGRHYGSSRLYLLTDEIEAKIAASIIAAANKQLWYRLRDRIERLKLSDIEPTTLATGLKVIEIALDEIEPKKEKVR